MNFSWTLNIEHTTNCILSSFYCDDNYYNKHGMLHPISLHWDKLVSRRFHPIPYIQLIKIPCANDKKGLSVVSVFVCAIHDVRVLFILLRIFIFSHCTLLYVYGKGAQRSTNLWNWNGRPKHRTSRWETTKKKVCNNSEH